MVTRQLNSLVSHSYIGQLSEPVSLETRQALEATKSNITGFSVISDNCLFQVIEGSQAQVDQAFSQMKANIRFSR